MMTQHTNLLEGVKDVLKDEESMRLICEQNKEEIQEIFLERQLKWRLQELIAEGNYVKETFINVPEDLYEVLGNAIDEDGQAAIKDLQTKEISLRYQKEEDSSHQE